MLGCLLVLQGDGPIVDEGLEGLPVFAFEHHFKLVPVSFIVIGFFDIDVEGLQVVNATHIKCSPVLRLPRCVEAELWASQCVAVLWDAIAMGSWLELIAACLGEEGWVCVLKPGDMYGETRAFYWA